MNLQVQPKIKLFIHTVSHYKTHLTDLQRVAGTHHAPTDSLIKDVVKTAVHITHTPHARLVGLLVLGEPVVQVVDVVGTGSSSQTLNECGKEEVLQTGSGTAQILATSRCRG